MHNHDLVRLRHMLDAAREAIGYARNKTRKDLDENTMLTRALVQCIEVIGEAATNVSKQSRAECPGILWDNIIGMRNRLIHAYFDINLDIVWSTVKEDLPPLILELERIISK
jgi:uncharacterized protein with HEPN domain